MTLAKDVVSNFSGSTTGDASWTHTPSGTPRGVIVFVLNISGGDSVSTVTYGGVSCTEMTSSPYLMSTAGEGDGYYLHAFLLGSSVPTGAQTVYVTDNGSAITKRAYAITVTGAADVVETDTDTASAGSGSPSGTLSLGGTESFCALLGFSGQGDVTGITPLTNWTDDIEIDVGASTQLIYTYDIVSTSDVTVGWTQGTDEYGYFAVAISEGVGGGGSTAKNLLLLGVG